VSVPGRSRSASPARTEDPGREPVRGTPRSPRRPPSQRSALREFLHEHRRSLLVILLLGITVVGVVAILPQVAGFGQTLHRIRYGDKVWLGLGVGLECVSLFGYMAVFRSVFACHRARIGWKASYQITLAGVMATKLLAAAGAGGIAVTSWALSGSGLRPQVIARRLAAFEILLYAVFMSALVLFGFGLYAGLFPGPAPFSITMIPGVFGAVVILGALSMRAIPRDVQARLAARAGHSHRLRRLYRALATVPQTLRDGIATAIELVRDPEPGMLGAIVYWGFDIATLWAGMHAFGASPPLAALVISYYLGQLGNVIPLPGGVGGVEGALIGSMIAFGQNGSTAVLGVLAYRLISFWLPTIPGGVAYVQLRRLVAGWREQDGDGEAGAQQVPE
jgi:uncharacterized protein (TIRG00374 family)